MDLQQTQMLEYVQPTTRDALLLKGLLEQRAASTAENLTRQATQPLPDQLFFGNGESSFDNVGGRKSYKKSVVKFGYYSYATGGVKLYNTLVANTSGETKLPSLATVKRFGADQPSIVEGELQVDHIKNTLIARGLPLAVWVSEDDTKVQSVLKYSSRTNEIVGLDLPIGEDGLPVTGSYKFTSITTAMQHIKNNPMSTYLKTVICRALHKDSYKFLLLAYGTSSGSPGGQTAGVRMRWKSIVDALEAVDIKACGKYQARMTIIETK